MDKFTDEDGRMILINIQMFMSHINRNINSMHNYKLTPSLKKYIECLTIHDNTFSNIYIVYLHISGEKNEIG
jgi:hypothetical protein